MLTVRQLNRALLARQGLLERWPIAAADALARLIGMQSQVPLAPYVGLWSRVAGFDPAELAALLQSRRAVRPLLMRATRHLVTADDELRLDPVLRPVLARAFASGSPFGRLLAGLDLDALRAAIRELVADRPLTLGELGVALAERFPPFERTALATGGSYLVPLVQVPPRGVWGKTGQPRLTTADTWIGRPFSSETNPSELIRRYLAAFGPASVADVSAWSGLTGLRALVEPMRRSLTRYEDDRGRELLDVPGAALPDPATPAPARFLPDFDNIQFAHRDRRRIIPAERERLVVGAIGRPCVLVDGFIGGFWKLERGRGEARLKIELFDVAADDAVLRDEGRRLLAFLAPEAEAQLAVSSYVA